MIMEVSHWKDCTSIFLLIFSAGAGRDAYFEGLSCMWICIGLLWRPQNYEPSASGNTVGVFWSTACAVVVKRLNI